MSTDPAVLAELTTAVDSIGLVDHHVHGALRGSPLDRADFERHIAETDRPGVGSWFDSQLGVAILRHCSPVLGLEPHVDADTYVRVRRELGSDEVNRRFLSAAGVSHFLVESGYRGAEILGPEEMAAASGRDVSEVVRLETVAETLAAEGAGPREFVDGYAAVLATRCAGAVGLKSIVAYRYGFDFEPERPSDADVLAAAERWLAGGTRSRLDDPTLLRFLIWSGVDTGLPIQFHSGFGDPDLELHRADPLLLTRFIKLVEPRGTQVVLLHCYPFHRNAGYLARSFPHVTFDVGLAVNYLGSRAQAVVEESMELAPFDKLLFSSDAWGPAELHHLGALLWRRATTQALAAWVSDGDWSLEDAVRVAGQVGAANARRVYGLEAG